MNTSEPEIRNKFGEKLDTWVESPDGEIKATVIMVHGFGTDKHETAGYFDDISQALLADSFRVIRFDFSGYGKSEGKEVDACYSKHIHDLNAILEYARLNYPGQINIFAQSMGCFVTALTSPDGISKTLMTGIPNSDPQIIIDRVSKRFGSRAGAVLNMDGISLLPRSTGKIQQIGALFWQDIRDIQPVLELSKYSLKTNLLIVHWESDDIIGSDYLAEYDNLSTLEAIWLPGDHSVSKPVDRKRFIKKMLEFYNKP